MVHKFFSSDLLPWWFLSTSTPDGSYNDLMLLKSIMGYAEVDKLVSNSAEEALLRHLWYIAPEMIPLSLLSSVVSTTKKELQKIFCCVNLEPVVGSSTRFGAGFRKPDFPFNVDKSTSLSELIIKDSCFFSYHAN